MRRSNELLNAELETMKKWLQKLLEKKNLNFLLKNTVTTTGVRVNVGDINPHTPLTFFQKKKD